ncbi:MAG: YidC/Oxa1 family membrane protein insertase [Gemmataceae bacterium]
MKWIGLPLLLLAAGPAFGQDLAWLKEGKITRERVTEELNRIANLPPDQAEREAKEYTTLRDALSDEPRHAATLLAAEAWNHAGRLSDARPLYESLEAQAADTPYDRTAQERLFSIDKHSSADVERHYKQAAYEPGAGTAEAWFVVDGRWTWTTQRQAALQFMAGDHANHLWVQALNWLRSLSPFPPAYHYLFILLVLTVVSQILLLPLLWPVGRTQYQMRRLGPEIESIRQIYASDFMLQQQHIQALYVRNGVRSGPGCWLFVADVVFVVWALVALRDYAPQMALDGSRFIWISDVTRFDAGSVLLLVACWLLKSYVLGMRLPEFRFPPRMSCGASAGVALLLTAAAVGTWPAYVFLFASLLVLAGAATVKLLSGIAALRDRGR